MKLLSFFKRMLKMDDSPEQSIRGVLDYVPDYYKTHRQFVNCVEYLEHFEWELALDSLIQLSDETEHSFADGFWHGLANAADKMGLADEADYCKKRIW